METGVIAISFKDGRLFNIFFANTTQKRKALSIYRYLDGKGITRGLEFICNGIHTVKEFEKHLDNI